MDFPLSCLITRGYIPICPTFPMIADSHPFLLVKSRFPNPTLLSDPARVLIPRSTVNNGWQSTQKDSEHQQKSTKNMDSDTEEKEHSRKFWRSKKSQNSHKIIAMLRIIAGDHVTMALFFGELGILGAFGVLVDGNLENLLGHVFAGDTTEIYGRSAFWTG